MLEIGAAVKLILLNFRESLLVLIEKKERQYHLETTQRAIVYLSEQPQDLFYHTI